MKTHSLDSSYELYTDDEYHFENENQGGYLTLSSDYPFWESQLYHKKYFKKCNKRFSYFDSSNIFRFLFFGWVRRWTKYISKEYVEPYKLHPLPVSDQILYWQPIFSKHVSDGLVRLENYETNKTKSNKNNNIKLPYKSILIRATVLTFWKRVLFIFICIIFTNVFSLSISFLVDILLEYLSVESFKVLYILIFLVSILLLQLVDSLITDNITFYNYRLIYTIQYSFSITIFQHGLCHRRKYFNNVEGSNALNVCNNVLHSFSPDSECSKNPLYCPARRYQNKELTPNIFTFQFSDSYYISMVFESLFNIINFLSNFIYGVLLMSFQIKVNLWLLYVVGLCFVLFMVFVEIVNTYVLKFIFLIRDYRISKCIDIIPALPIINKMFMDDIAINIITEFRNNELILFLVRIFLTYFNTSLYIIFINLSFYVIMRYFVKTINNVEVITEIDTAGFVTALYIFLEIIESMFLIPLAFTKIANAYVTYNRVKLYTNQCSPNFYISDNKFTGKRNMSTDLNNKTNEVNKDVVVLYKDASFAWIHSKKELINMDFDYYLENINFELKRGEVAIITGSQGSGKSNFIKSVLGEMTLVGGSMAVIPLHTSMPIFYASQDIWLKKGTIRTNVTFGYKYDESLYNVVLKAVELEYDISTWEKGDMRVVYDNGYCLSGGQRVRMELARAIYAYMIFSQVNKQYNDGKCSFLMCLDSSFNGLDPFVSKTIFNNLFNSKSGLLIKDDLSVILSSSKRSLDICVGSSDLKKFPDIPVYNIINKFLSFNSSLSKFMEFYKNTNYIDYNHITSAISNESYFINYLSKDMFKLCSSGSDSRDGRRLVTKAKYDNCFSVFNDRKDGIRFNPYVVYFTPALSMFVIFIFLIIILTIMDNIKFVFATNLSDYISKNIEDYNNNQLIDMAEIRSRADYFMKIVTIVVSVIIGLSLISSLLFSISCVISSRKIHEYCIDSIFNNSSSVIKIKNYTSQILTYLSSDIDAIDDDLCYDLHVSLVSFIQMLINLFTLFYLIPLSIPFVVLTIFAVYKIILLNYVGSFKNLQYAYLESVSHINNVFENAISGSSIYRSYKKESELVKDLVEHSDYFMRNFFLFCAVGAWSSVMFKWIFSCSTLIMLVIQVFCNKFSEYKINAGDYGLSLSLISDVAKGFTNFSFAFASMEAFMCSVIRLKNFVPIGKKCVFKKSINIHQEYLPIKYSQHDYKISKKKLLKRRYTEFKNDNKDFKILTKLQSIKKKFFKPQIIIVDVTNYVTPEHQGVQLKDVRVYTSLEKNVEGMILKGLTVSAHKSDIIGIIGRTGAGKTTLLSVLENTVRNRTGQVLLDGKDLNDIPKNVTRQIIGVLPQLPFVFKGWTVRRFLDPRKLFSDDEINQALDNCGLLEFVNNLQGGKKLDTKILEQNFDFIISKDDKSKKNQRPSKFRLSLTISDLKDIYSNSDGLSSSQLRTLSFARLVLYRYFYRIIIIDEPPSENCEGDEENFVVQDVGIPIYELLQKYFKHCTSFVTAHDVNVLKMCNSVWVMHDGQLIRTCKSQEITLEETLSHIIEQSIKNTQHQ